LALRFSGDLTRLEHQVEREAADIGMAFRLPDEDEERIWPLCSLPIVIPQAEWRAIEAAMVQRADLLEAIAEDVHGDQSLVRDGDLPAAAVTGSPSFWRQLIGLKPAGGYHLRFMAVDLGRGPGGDWRVLADHTATPAGAGYALENRIALSRATGELYAEHNVLRLAPFFSDFRAGLVASAERVAPRMGLLTPGRYNPSYAEQAHLARYLGFILVEGADLDMRGGKLYVRTIEGLKRVDVLWRRLDARFLDPLAFDVHSQIGTPGLFDAFLAGNLVLANAPGVGVLESPALAAFLPELARKILNEDLKMPNIATWWCGQDSEREQVLERMHEMVIETAFAGQQPAGLPDGEPILGSRLTPAAQKALLKGMDLRPQDYVGREVVKLSTTPAFNSARLEPRPFTIRVFLARDAEGRWQVMPGGFARLSNSGDVRAAVMGEGAFSADVCIISDQPVAPTTLIADPAGSRVIRQSGVLPSRAADSLYWLGRYVERGKNTSRVIRETLGGSTVADSTLGTHNLIELLAKLLIVWGAGAHAWKKAEGDISIDALCRAALAGRDETGSVRAIATTVRGLAEGIRDRLSPDLWRMIDDLYRPSRDDAPGNLIDRTVRQMDKFTALGGLAAEYMVQGAGWRFHDLGRRVERAIATSRMVRTFAGDDAAGDQLSVLLDLADNQVTYRSRYQMGLARDPVRDLVALDPLNPRSLTFQTRIILEHIAALPVLRDDGMPEEPKEIATGLSAMISVVPAGDLNESFLLEFEARLMHLSDALGRRYFLQGSVDAPEKAVTRLA
jgi:uncharacterized circularly permuted ATP-grasp superfamily protein/uncharacterized alpha-E superfamily protein